MQVHTLVFTVFQRVSAIFLHEKLGARHAETVNALFHISDHKNIMSTVRLFRDCPENRLLHIVGILVFINHDFLIISAQFLRCAVGLMRLFIHQDFQCKMFQIVEIQHIFFTFFFSERMDKCQRHFNEHICHRAAFSHILHRFTGTLKKELLRNLFY